MALRSGLAIYVYTVPTGPVQPPVVREYGQQLEQLRMTSVMPGGAGQLTARLKIADARQYHPEFQLFSKVVVKDGADVVWFGEISDPVLSLRGDAELVQLAALGAGNTLRDDPHSKAYGTASPGAILRAELSDANATNGTLRKTLRLDPDISGTLALDTGVTISPAYDARTHEEIVSDLCVQASATTRVLTWRVQPHATNRDAVGFPTAQLIGEQKDTSTTHWTASAALREVQQYDVGPSADRAYNYITCAYDNGAGGIGSVSAKDSRLNADLSQGSAPFPCRHLHKDLTGISTATSTQAQNIANAYLAQYQNGPQKGWALLGAVRDANGNPAELWRVRAGQNIFIPELAVRGQTLATAATPGVNQFYITQTEYQEDRTSATLRVTLDNFTDRAGDQIARLSAAVDAMNRSRKVTSMFQTPGAPQSGQGACSAVATAAGQAVANAIQFVPRLSTVPTSGQITITTLSNTNTNGTPTIFNISADGAVVQVLSSAAGPCLYVFSYKANV
jgi:hypothetical protein